MHVVVLKVVLVVQVLLAIVDTVLEVLEKAVQVLDPLVVKQASNTKDNVLIVANMATKCVIVFNINILLL